MRVRRIRPGEGGRIRELRLRALMESPHAFSISLAHEQQRPEHEWATLARDCAEGGPRALYVAEGAGAWLGMAGAYREGDAAVLWGMWVDPAARRRGLARSLLAAVDAWALEVGAARVKLVLLEGNGAAAATYERLGFELAEGPRPAEKDPALTEVVLARPVRSAEEPHALR